jgi:hypothetical protein
MGIHSEPVQSARACHVPSEPKPFHFDNAWSEFHGRERIRGLYTLTYGDAGLVDVPLQFRFFAVRALTTFVVCGLYFPNVRIDENTSQLFCQEKTANSRKEFDRLEPES